MDRFEEMRTGSFFTWRTLFLQQNAYFTKIPMSQKAVGSRSSGQEAGFSSAGCSLRQCHCVTIRYGYPSIAVSIPRYPGLMVASPQQK
jgi:hypothetical protein